MDRVVRINTRSGEISVAEVAGEEKKWGGRSFVANILRREVPPACEPLGRQNKLIIALGLLADTGLSTAGQLSIGGKSPLTGGVKESNCGGFAAKRLGRLGIRALIFEDAPPRPVTRVLVVSTDGIRLEDAPELQGALVSETFKRLREKYGTRVGLICIGPAGEMLMYGAGVATTDDRGVQTRYAARGGLGAVMGSKGVKAVVIDDKGAPSASVYDPDLLRETILSINKELAADPKSKNRKLYGTLDILEMANHVGLMPTRNFSAGSFELAHRLTGDFVSRIIAQRGGEGRSGTPCVQGCTIQCSNVFPDQDGKRVTASIQYESVVLLGPNCGIGDIDEICRLNELCNEVGVDTIETGAALGVAMEAGIIKFGDAEGAKNIVRQIGQGTLLGRVIGNGAALTGRVLGVRRIPAVKGQAIPAYDPRALKGNGVTYLTSPMGADHTAGNCFETIKTNDPLGLRGQVENSWRRQVRAAILDLLGLCLFIRPAFVKNPGYLPLLLKGRYGWDLTFSEIKRMGVETIRLEREFNRLAGVPDELSRIPEFMTEEPLPPTNAVFDLPQEEIDRIWTLKDSEDEF